MLGIDKGSIEVGKVADITVIDPEAVYKVDTSKFASKSKNSPFDGYEVKGKIEYTIVGGNVVVEKGELA